MRVAELLGAENPAILLLAISWLVLSTADWYTSSHGGSASFPRTSDGTVTSPELPSGHPPVVNLLRSSPCAAALESATSSPVPGGAWSLLRRESWGLWLLGILFVLAHRYYDRLADRERSPRAAGDSLASPVDEDGPAVLRPGARVVINGSRLRVPGPPPGPPPLLSSEPCGSWQHR